MGAIDLSVLFDNDSDHLGGKNLVDMEADCCSSLPVGYSTAAEGHHPTMKSHPMIHYVGMNSLYCENEGKKGSPFS